MKQFAAASVFLMILIVMLSGCGKEKYAAVPINEATDKCAICNMQVKDDAFATQLTTKEGKNYKFDDLGCMNEWVGKYGIDTVGAEFVRDYNTKEWINYDKATYVYDASFKTPMAYGIYSFKDKSTAQTFIDEQKKGKLMSAADLKNHTWERAKGAMDMGDMHSHDSSAPSESGSDMKTDHSGKH
ncbi:NosL [Paenibacillus konkukensis]|uniref:NosL n=1 Tax=Paenibacillus konkukensis TaxID=2020716 RepID=A0ABY4RGD9_9BACL|nr:nitrous oxide reductase accessory protein NosL [Paenibacillus konkukensis]UQZ81210.1 NosL [Paenibacillus konkukensis]